MAQEILEKTSFIGFFFVFCPSFIQIFFFFKGLGSPDRQKRTFKMIFMAWRILLMGYFERVKIILQEKYSKHRKIILLINFIFAPTFFLIASHQILKNYAILINYKSFFQGKHFPQLHHFQFSKMNKLLSNSAICL